MIKYEKALDTAFLTTDFLRFTPTEEGRAPSELVMTLVWGKMEKSAVDANVHTKDGLRWRIEKYMLAHVSHLEQHLLQDAEWLSRFRILVRALPS